MFANLEIYVSRSLHTLEIFITPKRMDEMKFIKLKKIMQKLFWPDYYDIDWNHWRAAHRFSIHFCAKNLDYIQIFLSDKTISNLSWCNAHPISHYIDFTGEITTKFCAITATTTDNQLSLWQQKQMKWHPVRQAEEIGWKFGERKAVGDRWRHLIYSIFTVFKTFNPLHTRHIL